MYLNCKSMFKVRLYLLQVFIIYLNLYLFLIIDKNKNNSNHIYHNFTTGSPLPSFTRSTTNKPPPLLCSAPPTTSIAAFSSGIYYIFEFIFIFIFDYSSNAIFSNLIVKMNHFLFVVHVIKKKMYYI